MTTRRPPLPWLLALALWAFPSTVLAEARLSGAAEAGLLTADASLHAHVGAPDWSLFIGAQFQGVAGSGAPSGLAPTLVVPVGLEAAAGPLSLTTTVSPATLDQPTTLLAAVEYTLDGLVSVSAETSAPVAALGSPAWALWVNVQLSDKLSTSCGGGSDIRPSTADTPEQLLLCLAAIEP